MSEQATTHYRACHLCEAICGLEIRTQGSEVLSIRGDKNDPVSRGYICPKATAIADIHTDPDRLRKPVKRVGEEWLEISWDEAIELTAKRLVETQQTHGANSVGFFGGNPGVHNYGNMTHGPLLRRAIKTRNNFSATSLDQLPHHLTSYAMYGHQFFLPIPDVDHTQLMVIFGGNPLASNGSIMTMPDAPKRLKAIQQRGGKLVVVDPRRTETADIADQHLFVKPGQDAYVLMAIINLLFKENWLKTEHLSAHLDGLDTVRQAVSGFSVDLATKQSGIPAEAIRQLAYDLAHTEQAVIYGRMGVSVQEFGALCQWAIQIINILIGALDSVGGSLLTSPAFGYVKKGLNAGGHFDLFQSRVSGLPEFAGELPAVTMAEEISTPGDGQIRAMVTIAGNPLISSANGSELSAAFEGLDFFLAIDFYINATTQHADVILPPTGPLEHDHYDIAFLRLAVHDSARYNPAVFEPAEGALHDWQIYNALAAKICELKGTEFRPLPAPDQLVAHGIAEGEYGAEKNPQISLTMDKLKQSPHGVDLGPLRPGLLERLCTEDGKIHCAPDFLINDLKRLQDSAGQLDADKLLLIGRRHVRSNNSWMHNYHRLVKGKPRWQLMMHPDDLAQRGIASDSQVTIESRVGSVTTTVIATDEVMPGVVSLPHGWGHKGRGVKMEIASQQDGVNCNELTDDKLIDKLSGNAALNGVPVQVRLAS
ncbi:molybdopterin oxidoreductase family protein [Arenicella xantha]|uniref:Anaerobic selenocysteine-containing dehydrogenase n=1 Tax=Arenicella xantha TaxID=644221 RepID=A0A395JIL2_9GAMM|nr:molybdopterin oxidoreductase family protein [Arenicella xantha]RBP48460.1 anaerobic selenocysteine-containing dehydrogenase [Arenicella xantha]